MRVMKYKARSTELDVDGEFSTIERNRWGAIPNVSGSSAWRIHGSARNDGIAVFDIVVISYCVLLLGTQKFLFGKDVSIAEYSSVNSIPVLGYDEGEQRGAPLYI